MDKDRKDGNAISRRDFLRLTAMTGLAAALPAGPAHAEEHPDSASAAHLPSADRATNWKIKIDPPGEEIRYRLIDSHLHYTDFLQFSDGYPALCKAMDMSGVDAAVIFGLAMAKQWDSTTSRPAYYLSNDSRCYYYSATDFLVAEELLAQPDHIRNRFYPFCCGFNGNDRFAADHVEQVLRLYPKFWRGIGELMSRHDDLTALTYGEAPHADGGGFLGIYDLAAQKGLPVLIHHNITAQNTENILYLEELKKALAYNRQCNIIWAHIGISRRIEVQKLTEIADEMLRTNPNLWVDISWVVYDYYFLDKFPNNYFDGNSLKDWTRLIERHPDRFLVGTDKVGHWKTYPAEVVKYYRLLDTLKPSVVDAICRDNLLSLLKNY